MEFGIGEKRFNSADMIEVRTGNGYEPMLYIPQSKDALYIVRFLREGVTVVEASAQDISDFAVRYDFPVLKEVVEMIARVREETPV